MDESSVAVINTKLDNIISQLTTLTLGQANLESRVRTLESSESASLARLTAVERLIDRPKGSWQATASTVAAIVSVVIVLGGLIYLGPGVGR